MTAVKQKFRSNVDKAAEEEKKKGEEAVTATEEFEEPANGT